MSGKKHRHHHDHDHRSDADRPASTDVADLDHTGADHAASAHQRKIAGRHKDERFSSEEDVASDVHARIIAVSVEGGLSKITMAAGHAQGVFTNMEGFIKRGDGMLADFTIDAVGERTAVARVELTPDMLHAHNEVIINPSTKPASAEPQHDVETRVIGVSIEGDRTKILLARGTSHGARVGQQGTLFTGSREMADFEIAVAHATHSEVYVHATPDMIHQVTKVLLNPSGGTGRAPAGAAAGGAATSHAQP